ncbi:MAG: hypothetical protein GX852_04795 [Clostridiales bacterium]|nr:hypothetical protein [Clostridiales bacterium]
MVEAAVSLPIIILAVMLLLRVFVFYIEIAVKQTAVQKGALEAWDSYKGCTMKIYEADKNVLLVKGGLLKFDVNKTIYVKAYFYNEDAMVRANKMLTKE